MARIKLALRDGSALDVQGQEGENLMKIIRDGGGYELLALCGGGCSCATCHVYIDPRFADALPPPEEMENELLAASAHRQPHSRLACQVLFHAGLDGMAVRIAPED